MDFLRTATAAVVVTAAAAVTGVTAAVVVTGVAGVGIYNLYNKCIKQSAKEKAEQTKYQCLSNRSDYKRSSYVKNFSLGHDIALFQFPVLFILNAFLTPYLISEKSLNEQIYDYSEMESNIVNIIDICLWGPVVEEIVARYIIQDYILTKLPKFIINNICCRKEIACDSCYYKAFKIISIAALFASCHHPKQYIHTLGIGVTYGILKENSGMASVIGAHITNNVIVYILVDRD